jgi:hypothetical protein
MNDEIMKNVESLIDAFLLDENSVFEGKIGCFDELDDIKAGLEKAIKAAQGQMHTVAAMVQEVNAPFIAERKIYLRMNVYQREGRSVWEHRWMAPILVINKINERYNLDIPHTNTKAQSQVDLVGGGNLYHEINQVLSHQSPDLLKHYRALDAVMTELILRVRVMNQLLMLIRQTLKLRYSEVALEPLNRAEENLARKYLNIALTTKHNFDLVESQKQQMNVLRNKERKLLKDFKIKMD